jgi:hypothetical protein
MRHTDRDRPSTCGGESNLGITHAAGDLADRVLVERFGASAAAIAVDDASILSTLAFLIAKFVHTGIAPNGFVRAIASPLIASAAMLVILRISPPAPIALSTGTEMTCWLPIGIVLGAPSYCSAVILLGIFAGRPAGAEKLVVWCTVSFAAKMAASWRRRPPKDCEHF